MTTCVSNSDCNSARPICNITRGLCIECNLNTDCENGKFCQNNICVEMPPCAEDINCSVYYPYKKCKRIQGGNNMCVECVENENCTIFQKCENNRCVRGANSPKECSKGCGLNETCVTGFCEKNPTKIYLLIIIIIIIIILGIRLFFKKKS